MADTTLAEFQIKEQALSGALLWANGEIEKLRNVLAEVEAMVESHSSCNPAEEECSARDDIEDIIVKWKEGRT